MDIFERLFATVDGKKMEFMVVGTLRNDVVELLNSEFYMLKLFDFTGVCGGWELWLGIQHRGKILDYFTGKAPLSSYLIDTPPKFYIRDKYDDFNFIPVEAPTYLLDDIYNVANFYLEPAPALFGYYSLALQLK